jgi:hypothetical protein
MVTSELDNKPHDDFGTNRTSIPSYTPDSKIENICSTYSIGAKSNRY